MINFNECIEKIHSISNFNLPPSLDRINLILEKIGTPQNKLKFVHIAGTNGKGTTASYIASCLEKSGYKVGLFTSPHLVNFSERFKINSKEIPENDLIEIYTEINQAINTDFKFTQFDFITAMAFLWFAKKSCDIVVLEVGLGGRFDATNIIKTPLVEVITAISLDHTQVLGNTVEEIAYEKAGIIKPSSDLVLYPSQDKKVFELIDKICSDLSATLHNVIPNFEIIEKNLMYNKIKYNDLILEIPFAGNHQILNALTALKALEVLNKKGFNISKNSIIDGFKSTRISARIQILQEKPLLILDGGHNEACAKVLADFIDDNLKNEKLTAIIGMVKGKDCEKYIEILAKRFTKIITTKIDDPRTVSALELANIAKKYCSNVSICENINLALKQVNESTIICGSLYLAGEVLNFFNHK